MRAVLPVLAMTGPLLWAAPASAQADADAVLPQAPVILTLPEPEPQPVAVDVPTLPEPVVAMLRAAIADDDPVKIAAVAEFARKTQPQFADRIDAMQKGYLANRAEIAAAKAQRTREQIRQAGVLKLWKGEGELGLLNATGNTSSLGVAASLKLERKGIDWTHKLQLRADYQRDNGAVSREQYLAAYSPRVQIHHDLYAFGLTQFERDRFQGYRGRTTFSAGVGYQIADSQRLKLSVEGGPAWRHTAYVDEPTGNAWSALGTANLEWTISPRVKFTQDASAFLEADNSTLVATSALEAGMTSRLKAKISYHVEHETAPPEGTVKTDTLSRLTFVYGF